MWVFVAKNSTKNQSVERKVFIIIKSKLSVCSDRWSSNWSVSRTRLHPVNHSWGSFFNYVDQILPIIVHLSTFCWDWWGNSFIFLRENLPIIETSVPPTYLSCLVNIVKERPPWCPFALIEYRFSSQSLEPKILETNGKTESNFFSPFL